MVRPGIRIVFGEDDGDESGVFVFDEHAEQGVLEIPPAPAGERFRYEVRTEGRLRHGPRRLLVDVEDDRVAVRDADGRLLWLETSERITFYEAGELVSFRPDTGAVLPPDRGEEAYALVNLMNVWEWVNAIAGVEVEPFRYRLTAEDGADVHVVVDPASGFAFSVVKTEGDFTFEVRAERREPSTSADVFMPAVLPWR